MPLISELLPATETAPTDAFPVEQADGVVRKITAQQIADNSSALALPLALPGILYGGTGVAGAARPITIVGGGNLTVSFDPTSGVITISDNGVPPGSFITDPVTGIVITDPVTLTPIGAPT